MNPWEDIMVPAKPSNTQVVSPLGSFVVEQHSDAGRQDIVKQRYANDTYGSERGIAIVWTLLLVVCLAGAVHHRLGKPEIAATSTAEAATKAKAATKAGGAPSHAGE